VTIMTKKVPLAHDSESFPTPAWDASAADRPRVMATRDHETIRDWARRHQATPATGEASASGPATVAVTDGGAGIRFNFPAAARYRPISWDEWFEHFDGHHLAFIYEEQPGSQGRTAEPSFPPEPSSLADAARLARYRLMRAVDVPELEDEA
jgi:hypothetical protein